MGDLTPSVPLSVRGEGEESVSGPPPQTPGKRLPHASPRGVVAIVGHTGVGKSALALHLAQAFGGEIVNADSRQVYRGMDIGTAKPSPEERALVPHHLFDLVDPDGAFSLALYQEKANAAIQDILSRGRLPLLVGGSGQYVWAVLEGVRVPRVPPDPAFRRAMLERAERDGPQALFAELEAIDPEAARRIDPRNVRRVVRALEVCRATGARFSDLQRKEPPPFESLVIGLALERAELYRRIDARVDAMVAQGWVEEVRVLLERGYSLDLPSMSAVGYREIALHLRGDITLDEAVARAKASVHGLVRHQGAWFRRSDPRIRWLDAAGDVCSATEALVREWLAGSGGSQAGRT